MDHIVPMIRGGKTTRGALIEGGKTRLRYLRQGASPAFEAFLRFPVNTILNLF